MEPKAKKPLGKTSPRSGYVYGIPDSTGWLLKYPLILSECVLLLVMLTVTGHVYISLSLYIL